MDKLFDTVNQALDGLLIPPLHKIVNSFLPERVLLESSHLPSFIAGSPKVQLTPYIDHYAFVDYGHPGPWLIARFPTNKEGVDPFELDFTPITDQIVDSAVVIYHGQTQVVQVY
jgi:hypothetical protein